MSRVYNYLFLHKCIMRLLIIRCAPLLLYKYKANKRVIRKLCHKVIIFILKPRFHYCACFARFTRYNIILYMYSLKFISLRNPNYVFPGVFFVELYNILFTNDCASCRTSTTFVDGCCGIGITRTGGVRVDA